MTQLISKEIKIKENKTIKIRSAMPTDAENIIAFTKEILNEDHFMVTELDEFTMTPEKEGEWINNINSSTNEVAILAEHNGELVGFLNFNGRANRKRLAHTGAFGMSVKKNYRSLCVGSVLLQTLIDWARAHPTIEKVSLAVFATNQKAIALYHKLGFIEEGRRIREVRLSDNTYVDDILMYKWVK